MFELNDFLDRSIANVKVKKKINKLGKINLASNELVHFEMKEIIEHAISKIDYEDLNFYSYYPKEIKAFANLININYKNIALFPGSDAAIRILLSMLRKKCEYLIIQTPNYDNYYLYANLYNFKVIEWKMKCNLDFSLNELYDLILKPQKAIVVLTSPHGHTGKVISYNDLNEIQRLCQQNNKLLLLDCAYIAYSEEDYTHLNFTNVILINTLSKSLGMAGARFAYVCANEKFIEYLNYYNGVNEISGISHKIVQLLLNNKNTVDNLIRDLKMNREHFYKFLVENTPWIPYKSSANFILIEFRSKVEANEIYELLYQSNIVVRNLTTLDNFDTHLRITISDSFIMKRVMEIIIDYLNGSSDYDKHY